MNNHQAKCPSCENPRVDNYLLVPDRFHGRTVPYLLVRCPVCSLVWMDEPPKTEELSIHYSKEYDRSIAAAGDNSPDRWIDRKQALTQYKKNGAILDLGCSAGSFLRALGSNDWDLHGIEMSVESAKRAQTESGAKVFVGDILDARFQPASFDVITCFHVFEHLYRPRDVLQKVFEWLKPGGIFYVLVPNIDSAGARIFRSYWYALELPRHVFHYSPRSLGTMARSVGFEPVSVTTHRELFFGQSTRYILDDMLRGVGIQRVPPSNTLPPGIMFRLVRKAFRLSILPLLTGLASVAGAGESLHAVFKKNS